MNRRIRKKRIKAEIAKRCPNVIYVGREDMAFLRNLLKEPPRDLPWIREVPKKLFLEF